MPGCCLRHQHMLGSWDRLWALILRQKILPGFSQVLAVVVVVVVVLLLVALGVVQVALGVVQVAPAALQAAEAMNAPTTPPMSRCRQPVRKRSKSSSSSSISSAATQQLSHSQ